MPKRNFGGGMSGAGGAGRNFGEPERGYIGGSPAVPAPSAQPPSGPTGFLNPVIPFQTDVEGDTVYATLGTVFDPRTLSQNKQTGNTETTGNNRYSGLQAVGLFGPALEATDLIRQYWGRVRPGRTLPSADEIGDMLATIADVSRMLTIFYSAGSMARCQDQEMRARARRLDLQSDAVEDMRALLSHLPCPRNIVRATSKYVGLIDVSDSLAFQYVGFLGVGNYSAFETLYRNVRARNIALTNLRLIYPELGVLDPYKETNYDPDVFQAFINCHTAKPAFNDDYRTYVTVAGASEEPTMLQSAGYLISTVTDDNNGDRRAACNSAWIMPGTGINNGSVRSPYSWYCTWQNTLSEDVALSYGTSQAVDTTGPAIGPLAGAGPDLASNVAHEYNMNSTNTIAARTILQWDNVTGAPLGEQPLALENTWYRVSGEMSLSRLAWRFQRNHMAGMEMMLSP